MDERRRLLAGHSVDGWRRVLDAEHLVGGDPSVCRVLPLTWGRRESDDCDTIGAVICQVATLLLRRRNADVSGNLAEIVQVLTLYRTSLVRPLTSRPLLRVAYSFNRWRHCYSVRLSRRLSVMVFVHTVRPLCRLVLVTSSLDLRRKSYIVAADTRAPYVNAEVRMVHGLDAELDNVHGELSTKLDNIKYLRVFYCRRTTTTDDGHFAPARFDLSSVTYQWRPSSDTFLRPGSKVRRAALIEVSSSELSVPCGNRHRTLPLMFEPDIGWLVIFNPEHRLDQHLYVKFHRVKGWLNVERLDMRQASVWPPIQISRLMRVLALTAGNSNRSASPSSSSGHSVGSIPASLNRLETVTLGPFNDVIYSVTDIGVLRRFCGVVSLIRLSLDVVIKHRTSEWKSIGHWNRMAGMNLFVDLDDVEHDPDDTLPDQQRNGESGFLHWSYKDLSVEFADD